MFVEEVQRTFAEIAWEIAQGYARYNAWRFPNWDRDEIASEVWLLCLKGIGPRSPKFKPAIHQQHRRSMNVTSDMRAKNWGFRPQDKRAIPLGDNDVLIPDEEVEFVGDRLPLEGLVIDMVLPVLSHNQQAILQMRARGLTLGEIATALGTTENTVHVALDRAKKVVAEVLDIDLDGSASRYWNGSRRREKIQRVVA